MGNVLTNKCGYVDTYTLVTDNPLLSDRYSCTLNTIGKSDTNSPSSSIPPFPTITNTVYLRAIKNDWGLISPNIPTQMIIMSRDSKYIFLSEIPNDKTLSFLYPILYSLIKYKFPIPDFLFYFIVLFTLNGKQTYEPKDDGVYSKLPYDTDINKNLKLQYKLYLVCKNSKDFLNSLPQNDDNINYLKSFDQTAWNNLSFLWKGIYDLGPNPDTSKFCLNFEPTPPAINVIYSSLDCKYKPNSSSLIIPKYDSSDIGSILNNPFVIGGLICCCLLLIGLSGFAALTMTSKGSGSRSRRR